MSPSCSPGCSSRPAPGRTGRSSAPARPPARAAPGAAPRSASPARSGAPAARGAVPASSAEAPAASARSRCPGLLLRPPAQLGRHPRLGAASSPARRRSVLPRPAAGPCLARLASSAWPAQWRRGDQLPCATGGPDRRVRRPAAAGSASVRNRRHLLRAAGLDLDAAARRAGTRRSVRRPVLGQSDGRRARPPARPSAVARWRRLARLDPAAPIEPSRRSPISSASSADQADLAAARHERQALCALLQRRWPAAASARVTSTKVSTAPSITFSRVR